MRHSSAQSSINYSSCFHASADMLPLSSSSTSMTFSSTISLVESCYTFCNDTHTTDHHHHQHGQQYMLNRLRLLKIRLLWPQELKTQSPKMIQTSYNTAICMPYINHFQLNFDGVRSRDGLLSE